MVKKKGKERKREFTKHQPSWLQQRKRRQRLFLIVGISVIAVVAGVIGRGWYTEKYQPIVSNEETEIRILEDEGAPNEASEVLIIEDAEAANEETKPQIIGEVSANKIWIRWNEWNTFYIPGRR